jgi:type II secretory pathway pseudopilin PulG
MRQKAQSRGFSIIEIIVVTAIIISLVTVIAVSLRVFFTLAKTSTHTTQAAILLEETAEALLLLRDTDWDTHIAAAEFDTAYWLAWNSGGGAYELLDEEPSGTYERQVVFEEVERDGADVITESGTVDPNTRKLTISIYKAQDDELLAESEMLIHNSYDDEE